MAGPKPMGTEFGIHHRLESCAQYYPIKKPHPIVLLTSGRYLLKRSFLVCWTPSEHNVGACEARFNGEFVQYTGVTQISHEAGFC